MHNDTDQAVVAYPSVDILRGLAAVSVVVVHFIAWFDWQTFPTSGPLVWFRVAWITLPLFFVISGFVISTVTFARIDAVGPRAFRRPYLRKRAARIVLLYLLTCLVFVAFIAPGMVRQPDFAWQAMSHLLFVHNLFPETHHTINSPTWSVALEVQFYLLVALIAPWLRRARWWWIAALSVAIAIAWRAWAFHTVSTSGPLGSVPLLQVVQLLPGYLDHFAAGILLARFLRWRRGRTSASEVALVLPVTVLLWWLMFHLYWANGAYWDDASMVIWWPVLLSTACAGLVYLACCAQGRLWLELTRPLRYLGEISYGIYLWHVPVIFAVLKIDGITIPRALLLVEVASFLLAAASWHMLERPMMRRFGSSRAGSASPGPQPHPDSDSDSDLQPTTTVSAS